MKTTESSSNPDLQNWILDFLSKPNKVFDNLPPCPFAKKAWMDGNVEVKKFEGLKLLDKDLDNWNKEVVIYEFEDMPGLERELEALRRRVKRVAPLAAPPELTMNVFSEEEWNNKKPTSKSQWELNLVIEEKRPLM